MKDQLDRIENKLDSLLNTRNEHHGRITRLEAQAGFVAWTVAAVGAAVAWLLNWAVAVYDKINHQ